MKWNTIMAGPRAGRVVCAIFIAVAFAVPAFSAASKDTDSATDTGIFVEKVAGLPDDFIMGADVSSMLSLEESGVVFRNRAGEPADLFEVLAAHGLNSVRLRVWNDPFARSGVGFGGGNCDIERAIIMGKRATAAGLWVFLDFHYSDFWADPSKQQAPRAWDGLDPDEKADALYVFTRDALERALSSGVDVRMVQLGNETVSAMSGENNWNAIGKLLRAGSRAVREVSGASGKKIDIAIHFTNPEKAGAYERFARILKTQKVDYDVFASSWYPYWHGSPEEFTKALQDAVRISGKRVVCAEISYAHTYDDADGFPNTISRESVFPRRWPVTVQGQANAIRAAIAAVAAVGKAGIGVYYWEPAWLPVPGETREDREPLWERFGSGWATRAAAEYDPSDAGVYFGGTGWENQALFSFDGMPLDSFATWKLVRTGAKTIRRADSAEEQTIRVRLGDTIVLPQSVEVIMNDGSTETLPVQWNDRAEITNPRERYGETVPLAAIGADGVAEYMLSGTVTSGTAPVPVFARVYAVEQNYVENPGFEDDDLSMWTILDETSSMDELFVQEKQADAKTGNRALHFWSSRRIAFRVEQQITGLKPGRYKFSIAIHGGDAGNQTMYIYVKTADGELRQNTNVDGWRNFREPVIADILVPDGTITVGAYVSCDGKGWGSLDDFILAPVGE
ncbi:MAG: extra-cellular endo-beta-1,4-galactanase [Treponema sp.]|nr:extra-cellular endo-beta-1,4-galactanase [Treponema sp.]